MKKVYLSAALFLFSGIVIGQVKGTFPTQEKIYELKTNNENIRPTGSSQAQDRAPGDIAWSSDFSVAADWTAAGPSTDYTTNGWSIGSSTNGWYFPNTGDMGTTGDFARFVNGDPNVVGDVIENGPFTLEYNGTIDLSTVPAPHLEFEQYGARFITVQAVEVSTDGGNNWIVAGSNDDIPALTADAGAVYDQPQTRRFNITSAIAGNPSNVKIRLFWDGAQNGPNMNYIAYGWYVDDIRVVEGYQYDTEIASAIDRTGAGVNSMGFASGLTYKMTPVSQIDPVEFSAILINNGSAVAAGSNLSVTITDPNGTPTTVTSPSVGIPVGGSDSLITATYTPTAVGTYTVDFLADQTNPDGFPSNNTSSTSFEITEHLYSRDNGVLNGSIGNVSSQNGLELSIGNSMEIFNDGVVGAMEIVITSDPENVGQLIYGRIFLLDPVAEEFNEIAVTAEHEITNADLGTAIRLYLEEMPIEVFEGDELLVCAAHYGGNPEVRFGMAQPVEQGTVLGVDAGSDFFTLTDPEAIMVRLDMRDFTSVNENEISSISVSQNVPNPFDDNTVVRYNLNETANVSMNIVDVTGKVVATYNQGTQPAGAHTINISADKLSNGIYFYTFKAGEYSVTKRMVVSK